MEKRIEVGNLADIIAKELADYNENVEIMVDEESGNLAKSLVKDLKSDESIPKSNQNNRHYRDKFYMKKYHVNSKKSGYVVANRVHYLTHLLERGHVTRNGKRTRAFPHWEQANQKAQDLENIIRKQLEDGI